MTTDLPDHPQRRDWLAAAAALGVAPWLNAAVLSAKGVEAPPKR